MPKPTRVTLKVQHSSMEVFDSHPQQRHDAVKLFTLGSHIVTGTEAGPGRGFYLQGQLAAAAKAAGYLFWCPGPQDSWVAISRELVVPGSRVAKGNVPVLRGAKALGDPHPYGPKGIPWVTVLAQLDGALIGQLTSGSGHWLTKGRTRGQAQHDHPGDPVNHYAANTKMGKAVGKWAQEKGRGRALVTYGADTNLDDARSDVFRGAPLTTCHDDVGRWPNTGHGPIDVIARYDRDGRVGPFRNVEVLDDREFFLFGDHYTVTADLPVTPLAA